MCVSRGGAETVPFRDTDLTPDAAASWVARGYDPSDVDQFLSTLRTALSNPNQVGCGRCGAGRKCVGLMRTGERWGWPTGVYRCVNVLAGHVLLDSL